MPGCDVLVDGVGANEAVAAGADGATGAGVWAGDGGEFGGAGAEGAAGGGFSHSVLFRLRLWGS